jgi:hypothetical protein
MPVLLLWAVPALAGRAIINSHGFADGRRGRAGNGRAPVLNTPEWR